MARPSKSITSSTGKISKEEKEIRLETENKLKGGNESLIPASYLNERQVEIFNYILSNLEESKVLGNLDIFVLNRTAITIERLENLDKQANENEEVIFTTAFKSLRDMYSKDFFRCCNELCLSPQSRAKLSIAAVKQPEKKTLKDILAEDDE